MLKIRVRFAPSPTGYMHIGNFRTALYAFIFAKKNSGDFILRIEDTDKNRQIDNGVEGIIEILKWAGLKYDEGVYLESGKIIQKGNHGPYIQSERLEIYQKYAHELLDREMAYYCFCSSERLENMRNQQAAAKIAPMYDRTCLNLSKEAIEEKIKNGESYVIRQKINAEGFTEFDDLIRGKVKIKNDLLDDQVLMKSDGYPTYNFANVVDDHLMEITHVMRGEEYISSTPKYTQLYQNFGWLEPKIAHLPLILNPDKTKLSKRQGDVAVEDYIQNGYLKEAIINFVALLGWNPGGGETQEIFSLEGLIDKFNLSHVHKAGAVFDIKKFDWINSQWIKKLSADELYVRALPFLEKKEFYKSWNMENKKWSNDDKKNYVKKVLAIEQERLENLSGAGENNKFFFQEVEYTKELLRWKNMTDDEIAASLKKSIIVLENIPEDDWKKENLEKMMMESAGEKRGELLWPLRVSLTGEKKSPPPYEVAWVLGKNETMMRLNNALGKLDVN